MRRDAWNEYLVRTLSAAPVPRRLEETVALCRAMTGQRRAIEGERLSFWGFLSAIFRLEGIKTMLLQAAVLALACFGAWESAGQAEDIPMYMPLFILAALPSFFRGAYYRVSEIEAATRSSGPQAALARLVLAGGFSLVGMTVLLGLEVYLQGSCQALGRMALYCLVPYLMGMTATLFLLRRQRSGGPWACLVSVLAACGCWGSSSRLMPGLYEASAIGVWGLAFLLFSAFFVRETVYIINANREGKMYGIVT